MLTYPRGLPGLAYSVVKRPKLNVSVQTHQSGGEVRMSYWAEPLWEWDLTYEVLRSGFRNGYSYNELQQVAGLFLACTGNLTGFRFHDPDDNFRARTGIGQSNGVQSAFDLVVSQGAGGTEYIWGTEHIGVLDAAQPFNLYVNGAFNPTPRADPVFGYTLSTGTPKKQQLVFNTAPPSGATFTCDMSYFYYVRFQADSIDFEKFMHQLWSLKKVTLCSLRY